MSRIRVHLVTSVVHGVGQRGRAVIACRLGALRVTSRRIWVMDVMGRVCRGVVCGVGLAWLSSADDLSAGTRARWSVLLLGLAGTNLLYRWKREELERTGPVATSLEGRIRELEIELHRVERERDILKKALAIFGRNE